MPGIGVPELIIILVIVIVIFGAGRLGEIGGALGKGIREFRSATQDSAPPAGPPAGQQPAPPAIAQSGAPPAAGAVPASANKCPSCGTDNPVGQAFCGQCGTRLTAAA